MDEEGLLGIENRRVEDDGDAYVKAQPVYKSGC